ncbi:MAG: NYN domain-containing protein [Anaerolineae bacterium]|nr:NYN domain-containing protein [Anaerolineae bacterium]MCO5192302.1 NYN domain-containing protein [Anaerolineae bacterium]MCO5203780.1 NYN domain-containing protein [Anaerolineae bacterium]
MNLPQSLLKVGVYIDVSNLVMNGGFGMRYEVLRQFACRDGAVPMRLNAYVSFDPARAETDYDYRIKQYRFHAALRDLGYKVIIKDTQWYTDDDGNRFGKANVDLDLAVDALLQSENLDRVLLATGDGDFVRVVHALQNKGCRVEVVAFDNVSAELRREADMFMSGYLIPHLLPISRAKSAAQWNGIGSFVRGVCYAHDNAKGFGWLRYLTRVDGELWRTDSRDDMSPYNTIFCHDSEYPPEFDTANLTNRNVVIEFQITEGMEAGKHKAVSVQTIRART